MRKEFNLKYEKWAEPMDCKGTIRTVPENYYVADVSADNTLEFGNLEAKTRDINQVEVERWWESRDK